MDWQKILLSALGIVVTALCTWGMEKLISFLNVKIKNAQTLQYITEAVGIVSNSVKATYQTYVQSLKDKDMFDAQAQQQALTLATESAKSQFSKDLQSFVESNFGSLESWIQSSIESCLYDLKNTSDKK